MPKTAITNFMGIDRRDLVDRWLRFHPKIAARYDVEHMERRRADLRSAIYLGIVLYNVYNITSLVLLPDILWLSIALRVGLVTPVSLGLAWLIGRTTPAWTERLVLGGVLNAFFLPVFLFWLTEDPYGRFTFGELALIVVYANMLLALRFRHAVVFTGGALAAVLIAVLAKPGLEAPLAFAFAVQIATACLFSLFANYRVERRRCEDYLVSLDARLAAEAADAARRQFQDLSRTDPLTGLPNRRHLFEHLDEWFADARPIVVMMIDIDHFKLYNDAFGHPAGDECLRRVAEVFAAAAENLGVFCARVGGEEFTVAFRDAGVLEARRLAGSLVRAVEALGISHPSRRDGLNLVTISVGVALRAGGATASRDELLASSDRALYVAKNRGRNRFAFDEPTIAGEIRRAS